MKTLNIKVPYTSLQKYDNVDVELRNAIFRGYLESHWTVDQEGNIYHYQYDSEAYQGHMVTYTLKIDEGLHKDLKLQSIKQGINLNLYGGQVVTHEIEKRG